jgi:hypothetical protein
MRSTAGRIRSLERRAARSPRRPAQAPGGERPGPRTDREWLARFEECGRLGLFDDEPDFETALEVYRAAVEAAEAEGREDRNLPEWWWLSEMLGRVLDGRPPVTEAEFVDLSEWFEVNEARLCQDGSVFDLGDGESVSLADVRSGLWKGPRGSGATEVVERLRRLRARYDPAP